MPSNWHKFVHLFGEKGAYTSYAKEKGIDSIEAYPTIPTKGELPDSFVWTGLYSAFLKAGFEVVDRMSVNRPMVRYNTKL